MNINSLENRFPPPIIAMAIAAIMWWTARYLPHFVVADWLRFAGLIGISFAALVFGGPAILAFGRAKTTINPVDIEAASTLVTTGIFGISRNPMYVGLTALLLAWAVYLASPSSLLGVVIFALFTWRYQILPEERVLKEKFGRSYEEYQRRVRRWL